MPQADIGIIGLAVMGENLVLNMESRGYTVAVYNRTPEKVDAFIQGRAQGKNIVGTKDLATLVGSLKSPRKVMLMVKAGTAVDEMIEQLTPLLQKDDIIIDGGNSYFTDTMKRQTFVESKGLRYIGTGVSGGEEGALKGPSIMPGGTPSAWPEVKELFQAISAKVGSNNDIPCCEWVGPNGAGHYVKMIHNAIEYADMQLIAESYFVMRELLGMTPQEMADVFAEWNKGVLDSYLIEITSHIFQKTDAETGKAMIDIILDKAGDKGTGKWTSQNSLNLGVPIPSIIEAVQARYISAYKSERVAASKAITSSAQKKSYDRKAFLQIIHDALYASKIMAYCQGFALLKVASKEYDWNLRFGSLALLWRGGCIIRARFLEEIKKAFDEAPDLDNLMLSPYFKDALSSMEANWRICIAESVLAGIAVPCFASAITYFDSYRTVDGSANMIQAQRDYFGAHTYERIDKSGTFHTEWLSS
ncbi:NADP-dependent phosphogluconate dehydrogenase [Candidatus Uhrbacteria bacterium]|nr:NADP-dependent phosphogluconate dehydrogenase [Candidatus Uhrbacteria bacterium]